MKSFTQGELEVMQVLWENGELNPQQIQQNFPRPIKNAALRAALRVLLEKGHVTRTKVSRAYVYKARTPREGAFKKMVRNMAAVFCQGSPKLLVAQLVDLEKFSEQDIEELKKVLHQSKGKK